MRSYYPPLIFDIILSILRQTEFIVSKKNDYHYVDVYPYYEIGEDNFDTLKLFSLNAFYDLDTFYLIDCGICFGEHPYSPFVFRMGMDKCKLIFQDDGLSGVDALRFKQILPVDLESESWMEILSNFIDIIKYIIDEDIRMDDTSFN